MTITADEVLDYLRGSPNFFEQYPGALAPLTLPNQHSGRALSLHERQIAVLRDKHKLLETKIHELGRLGAENQSIVQKVMAWHRDLLAEKDPVRLPQLVTSGLAERFSIPVVKLALWSDMLAVNVPVVETKPDADDRDTLDDMKMVYCGRLHAVPRTLSLGPWLGEAFQDVQSLALIALRVGMSPKSFGVMILASPDPDRYTSTMAHDFLNGIAESASAALSRLLKEPEPIRV